MSVNLSNTTPPPPAGSTNVKFQTDGSGNVSAYVTSAVELTGNGFDATVQAANIAVTNLVAVPVSGRYRISAYIVVTQAATTSSVLPSISLQWNDADNGQAQTLVLTPTNAGNLLTTMQFNDAFLSVGASAPLSFSTASYASTGGTPMQFAIHITVESL
jgi:hypothetical protein